MKWLSNILGSKTEDIFARHIRNDLAIREEDLFELKELLHVYWVSYELAKHNIPERATVSEFIKDISRLTDSATLYDMVSLLAGEKDEKRYREMFGDKWQEKLRQQGSPWKGEEDILKTLMLSVNNSAQGNKMADGVDELYHLLRAEFARKAKEEKLANTR